jgi:hypothetical protein
VKDQLGHTNIQITVDTYGHLVPGGNRRAVDKLDDVLTPTPNAVITTEPENEEIGNKNRNISENDEEDDPQLADLVARPEGFEPPTPRSVVWCSVQLSYGRSIRWWRRERDLNPRYPFGVHTLSRRAP